MPLDQLTYPNKNTGDQWFASEATEVKTKFNSNATQIDTDLGLKFDKVGGEVTGNTQLVTDGLGTSASPNLLLGSAGLSPQIGLYQLAGANTNRLGVSIGGSQVAEFIYNSTAVPYNSTFKLSAGTAIGEFSTDGTMADDSNQKVPTEKAVRTYVDANSGQFDRTGTILTTKVAGDDLEIGGQIRATALNTGDNILTTDTSGNLQESGAKVETTAEAGSLFSMVNFTSAPTAPLNGDFWFRIEGGQTFFEYRALGITKSVELG